ncbi:MAG: type II secretion system minor pseudopilin GspK [Gammaproteobacteria bacterium]|nr:type II secretion system minor pseudopilin GspK [Gammaproteobacteria bacterium]
MTATRSQPLTRRRCRYGAVPSRAQQRGVALLVAILLVALGTIVAAAMAYNNAMTARRAEATFDFDQALLVAQGAEAVAAYGLKLQAQDNSPYIFPGQGWSRPLPPTDVIPGVTLEAYLEDMQGRFNINDLVETDGETPNNVAIQAFQRLLAMLNMDTKWANYIVDWIDKNTTPMFPDGAEDSVYMEMDPPYRTPNLPITSTSELLALPGFTRADFDKLSPYIVALPPGTTINVCSASPYVLDALQGHQQYSVDPQQFEKDREASGTCFPTQAEFLTAVGNVPGGGTVPGGNTGTGSTGQTPQQTVASLISQRSAWFRLTSFVTLGSAQFSVYTVLYWDRQMGVRPVMRSFTPD